MTFIWGTDAAALLRSGAWVPEVADVIKIETKLGYARVDRSPVLKVRGRTLNRLRSRHAGAGGYIVTRKGAEKLLRMSETFSSPADQFIFNLDLPSAASLATYQLLPAVCVQDFVVKESAMIVGLGSDLHDERTGEKLKGMSKLWRECKATHSANWPAILPDCCPMHRWTRNGCSFGLAEFYLPSF